MSSTNLPTPSELQDATAALMAALQSAGIAPPNPHSYAGTTEAASYQSPYAHGPNTTGYTSSMVSSSPVVQAGPTAPVYSVSSDPRSQAAIVSSASNSAPQSHYGMTHMYSGSYHESSQALSHPPIAPQSTATYTSPSTADPASLSSPHAASYHPLPQAPSDYSSIHATSSHLITQPNQYPGVSHYTSHSSGYSQSYTPTQPHIQPQHQPMYPSSVQPAPYDPIAEQQAFRRAYEQGRRDAESALLRKMKEKQERVEHERAQQLASRPTMDMIRVAAAEREDQLRRAEMERIHSEAELKEAIKERLQEEKRINSILSNTPGLACESQRRPLVRPKQAQAVQRPASDPKAIDTQVQYDRLLPSRIVVDLADVEKPGTRTESKNGAEGSSSETVIELDRDSNQTRNQDNDVLFVESSDEDDDDLAKRPSISSSTSTAATISATTKDDEVKSTTTSKGETTASSKLSNIPSCDSVLPKPGRASSPVVSTVSSGSSPSASSATASKASHSSSAPMRRNILPLRATHATNYNPPSRLATSTSVLTTIQSTSVSHDPSPKPRSATRGSSTSLQSTANAHRNAQVFSKLFAKQEQANRKALKEHFESLVPIDMAKQRATEAQLVRDLARAQIEKQRQAALEKQQHHQSQQQPNPSQLPRPAGSTTPVSSSAIGQKRPMHTKKDKPRLRKDSDDEDDDVVQVSMATPAIKRVNRNV